MGRSEDGRFLSGEMSAELREAISRGQIERHRRQREALKDAPPITTKICSRCKEPKRVPDDYVMRKRKLKSGDVTRYPSGECNECARKRKQNWADRNRETVRERQRRWNANRDPEHRRRYQRDYQRMQRVLEGVTPRGPWRRYRHELEADAAVKLDAQPLIDEIAGRWRNGMETYDLNLERMRVDMGKPTINDLVVWTGIHQSTIGDILRGQRFVRPHEAETILRAFGREDRLLELYPELQGESSGERVA